MMMQIGRNFARRPRWIRAFGHGSLVSLKKAGADGVAVVTLRNGPVNTLTIDMLISLTKAIAEAEEDNKCKSLVLSSSCRVFSAGLDLNTLHGASKDVLTEYWTEFQQTLRALYLSRLFTVSAINGHALAGGCILAICCDYRVITPHARIGLNETTFGLIPPPFAVAVMMNVVGKRLAERAMTQGTTFKADEALAIGLVDETVEASLNAEDVCLVEAVRIAAKHSSIASVATELPEDHDDSEWLPDIPSRSLMKQNLRQPLVEAYLGTEDARRADVDSFVEMISHPQIQKMLGLYLESLSQAKKGGRK